MSILSKKPNHTHRYQSPLKKAKRQTFLQDITNKPRTKRGRAPSDLQTRRTKARLGDKRSSQPRETKDLAGKVIINVPASKSLDCVDFELSLLHLSAKGSNAYDPEIIKNLKSNEERNFDSIVPVIQEDINDGMRSILVDWLVDVHMEYKLCPPTLHLTVNLVDRYLSRKIVTKKILQLLGITCMLVAAKYEEVHPPTIDDFVYITDNTYTRLQLLQMEQDVLNTLQFRLTVPTSRSFLESFIHAAESQKKNENLHPLAYFLADLTLQHSIFTRYRPSVVAASVVSLALDTLNLPFWNLTLSKCTGYEICNLELCLKDLHKVFVSARDSQLQAVINKYSLDDFLRISKNVAASPKPFSFGAT
eukprot:TRINITY_DN1164_c0_g1_i1.p1 TRINITY_DN1164_c0_g1~~TRINITY_DN1164_c0_g1_i1.p1  ORF type:complete len:362 (-),score=33.51 TRINITY_DN1164_c0_g1_i1:175-1260(-)